MRYFFDNCDKIKKELADKNIFLFLDYDGTLTPIVKKPELAKLDSQIKKLLRKISRNCPTAIISGRPLNEIEKLVGLKNIIYSGNHGFEIETQITADDTKCHSESRKKRDNLREQSRRLPQIFVQIEARKIKPIIQKIRYVLEKKIKNIKGAFVENKGLTLSIHWRLVDKKNLLNLFAIIRETIRNNSRVRLTKGKKVWEIRPNIIWDKGKAVQWILSLLPTSYSLCPIYIGDDTTDEDVFKVLKNGITIRIRKSKKSKARYYLKKQSEIKKLLNHLIA